MNNINLDESPSFYLKRARDVFENMMVNDTRIGPLKWIGLDSNEDYVEYTFYSDLSFYIDPITGNNHIRSGLEYIKSTIINNWKYESKKGYYHPIRIIVDANESTRMITVRLQYDLKVYYYLLASKEVENILKEK